MKTARTKRDILNHPAVDCFYIEDGMYWIELKPGWIHPDMECGLIHENTIDDCCCKLNGITNN